jgi:hypothetical protein
MAAVTALLFACSARTALSAELTAYVSGGSPSGNWGGGYGGMFSITLFSLVHGDAELGWQVGDEPETGVLLAAAKAYVGPQLGRVVPYAGIGVGYYAQAMPGEDVGGELGEFFVGAKVKVPLGFLLRGEMQWIRLGSDPSLPLDGRFFLGAGLSF